MSKRIAYCTIASANYLDRVAVLSASLREQQGQHDLHVLLCERPEVAQALAVENKVPFLAPDQVCPQWLQMGFYYNITEFNTSLKPFLIEYLFQLGYDAVVYLDPDIEVFASLAPIEDLLENHDLLLTPHVCRPLTLDGHNPSITDVVRAGQFNLGFIAMAACDETVAALKWWQEVCVEHCLFDSKHRYFVDQFWADILPSYIQRFYCLRDPSYNVAYWNVFQRTLLRQDKNTWSVDGAPLRFFHFSGLAHQDLERVSVHQDRVEAPSGSPLRELLEHYFRRLATVEWRRYREHPYSFACYGDGTVVSPQSRRKFLWLPHAERQAFGDPFMQPDRIGCLRLFDVDQLDEERLYYGQRYRRGLRYARQLWREFVASWRRRGGVLTAYAVVRFVGRRLGRLFGWGRG